MESPSNAAGACAGDSRNRELSSIPDVPATRETVASALHGDARATCYHSRPVRTNSVTLDRAPLAALPRTRSAHVALVRPPLTLISFCRWDREHAQSLRDFIER